MIIKPGTKFRVPTEHELGQAGWTLKHGWLWVHPHPSVKDGLEREFVQEHQGKVCTTKHREIDNGKVHWTMEENTWYVLEEHVFVFLTVDYSQLTPINLNKCDCGGDFCKTTHAFWCPKWSDK